MRDETPGGRAGYGVAGGVFTYQIIEGHARNSLIAANTASQSFPDAPEEIRSLGWNLIGITNGSSGWTANDFLGHSLAPLDPLLGPCQDNGGPVWTMCPLPGSPARDRGNSGLATDSRGGRRPVNFPNIFNAAGGDGSDIGAVEVDSLFRIVSITKSNTMARVRLKSDPGSTYTLQQTSVITNRAWADVAATRMAGTGQDLEAIDPSASEPKRFYRVLAEPFAVNQRAFVTDFNAGLPPGAALAYSGLAPGPSVSGGVLRLTEAVADQNNLFFLDPFSGGGQVASFRATFRVRLGDVSTNGPADGFSFSFGPDISNAPFIGEEGVGSGLRVTFDTWDNGPFTPGDPLSDFDAPSIEIFYSGVLKTNVSLAGNRFGGRAPATAIPIDPATGQPMSLLTGDTFADVEIRLNADGSMDVSYKGVKVLANMVTGYVPTTGRFAFGARTGGAWTTHYIDDLQIIVTNQP